MLDLSLIARDLLFLFVINNDHLRNKGMILGDEESDELKTICFGMYPETSLCIYVFYISYNYTWMSGVWAKTLQSTSYTTPHCYRSVLSNAKILKNLIIFI